MYLRWARDEPRCEGVESARRNKKMMVVYGMMDARGEKQSQRTSNDGYETTKSNGTTQTGTATAGGAHNTPESLGVFHNIVSLTAADTSRMLVVSVACVRLVKSRAIIREEEKMGNLLRLNRA